MVKSHEGMKEKFIEKGSGVSRHTFGENILHWTAEH